MIEPYMDARDIAKWYKQHPGKINPDAVTEHFKAGAIRALNEAETYKDYEILNKWLCQYKMMKMYFWYWATGGYFY